MVVLATCLRSLTWRKSANTRCCRARAPTGSPPGRQPWAQQRRTPAVHNPGCSLRWRPALALGACLRIQCGSKFKQSTGRDEQGDSVVHGTASVQRALTSPASSSFTITSRGTTAELVASGSRRGVDVQWLHCLLHWLVAKQTPPLGPQDVGVPIPTTKRHRLRLASALYSVL